MTGRSGGRRLRTCRHRLPPARQNCLKMVFLIIPVIGNRIAKAMLVATLPNLISVLFPISLNNL